MKEQIKEIAEHYGYEPQSRQLIEEMAELTVAINKFWRNRSIEKNFALRANIYEEIADVEIMLEQIKYLLDCSDEVENLKAYKVGRQLNRMKG